MAPASLLDSDDFKRLPPVAQPYRRRDATQVMSDGSTFLPSQAPEYSHATTVPTATDRRDLREDLKSFGYKFPPGRPATRGPIIPNRGPMIHRGRMTPHRGSMIPRPVVKTSVLRRSISMITRPVIKTSALRRPISIVQEQDGTEEAGERRTHASSDEQKGVEDEDEDDTRVGNDTPEQAGVEEDEDDTRVVKNTPEQETERDPHLDSDLLEQAMGTGRQDQDNEPESIDDNPFQLSQSDISRLVNEISQAPEAPMPMSTGLGHHVTQALNPLRTKTRDQLMQAYQEAKARGTFPFIDFIYNVELACTTLQGADREWTIHEAYEVYISFPEKIIDGLIRGTLPRSYQQAGSEECRIQEELRRRAIAANHPAYYMVTIADRHGEPPELGHVRDTLHFFEMYIDGDFGMILEIDKDRGGDVRTAQAGRRWYLDDEHGRLVPRRLQACRTFARNLSAEIHQLGPYYSFLRPFPHYFVYFGITGRLLARFEQHDDGKSSNYIMQLFRACLARIVDDDPGKYRLAKYVVGLCGQPHHAPLGEILVTRLGQGYVTSGTGFAHYPAGRSINISLNKKQWAAHWEWMYEHLPSEHNHEISLAQLAKPRQIVLSRNDPIERMLLCLIKSFRQNDPEGFMEGRIVEEGDFGDPIL